MAAGERARESRGHGPRGRSPRQGPSRWATHGAAGSRPRHTAPGRLDVLDARRHHQLRRRIGKARAGHGGAPQHHHARVTRSHRPARVPDILSFTPMSSRHESGLAGAEGGDRPPMRLLGAASAVVPAPAGPVCPTTRAAGPAAEAASSSNGAAKKGGQVLSGARGAGGRRGAPRRRSSRPWRSSRRHRARTARPRGGLPQGDVEVERHPEDAERVDDQDARGDRAREDDQGAGTTLARDVSDEGRPCRRGGRRGGSRRWDR